MDHPASLFYFAKASKKPAMQDKSEVGNGKVTMFNGSLYWWHFCRRELALVYLHT